MPCKFKFFFQINKWRVTIVELINCLYLYNILKHDLVPPHRILSETEKTNIEKKYNITNDSQFPEISRFDPDMFLGQTYNWPLGSFE